MADLVHPEIVIKRIGVDHDKREALPGDFVIDFDPISYTVRQRPLLPENGISSNQHLCRIPDLSKSSDIDHGVSNPVVERTNPTESIYFPASYKPPIISAVPQCRHNPAIQKIRASMNEIRRPFPCET